MSWHIESVGSPSEVCDAIDECVAQSGGMPSSVGSYLKDAVAACHIGDGTNYLIHVKSSGHRPMENSGSNEISEVRVIRRGAWKKSG